MSAAADQLAIQAIVLEHLELVNTLAKKAARRLPHWLPLDDLVQIGRMGLIQAAHRFDPARGCQFKTYAAKRILGAIYDAHRRKNYQWELHEELFPEISDLPKNSGEEREAIFAADDVEKEVNRRQVQAHLHRALRDLEENERAAVVEHALHEMNYSQIGRARDRSTSWAFHQAERGHSKLRESLRRVGIGSGIL